MTNGIQNNELYNHCPYSHFIWKYLNIFKYSNENWIIFFCHLKRYRPRWPYYDFNPLRKNSSSSQRTVSHRDNACVINLSILKRETRKKTKDKSRDFCLRISDTQKAFNSMVISEDELLISYPFYLPVLPYTKVSKGPNIFLLFSEAFLSMKKPISIIFGNSSSSFQ